MALRAAWRPSARLFHSARPSPAPGSGLAAGRLSVGDRAVGERSCRVFSEPALGHSAGLRVGPAWRHGAVGSARTGVHCRRLPWTPGPGVVPGGALFQEPGPLFAGHQGGLSPGEDEAGRSGEPGWAQRLLPGPRPVAGRSRWACGGSRTPAGCLAGSSWPWAHQGGSGGAPYRRQDEGECRPGPCCGTEDGRPGPCVPAGGHALTWTEQWETLGAPSPVPSGAVLFCFGV